MGLVALIILIVLAFLPPIIYAIWIRDTEKFHRERWKPITLCFIWGATISIVASIILESILDLSISISINNSNIVNLVTVIIIAPIAEEITKPIVIVFKSVKKELDDIEDGLIFGAVAGLGFSAWRRYSRNSGQNNTAKGCDSQGFSSSFRGSSLGASP